MNWADVYSDPSRANGQQLLATGPTGPNQSIVTGAGQSPSNLAPNAAGAPFAWLGLMLMLVLLYVAIRMGAKLGT